MPPLDSRGRRVGPTAIVLRVDDARLAVHPDVFGDDAPGRCAAFATALAASPAWSRLREDADLAVRPESGLIAIIGNIAHGDRPLLDAVASQTADLLDRLRPVPYPEAEDACLDLAARIRTRLSPGDLTRARIAAIPRGGFIVAGMLSYALGISAERVTRSATSDRSADDAVTILVDDCAISGLRLREHLADRRSRRILVALLHAHPELCRRVEESWPDVIACIAARELRDHAPRRPDHAAWARRWAERSPGDIWTGEPDHVVYPWNEPDTLIWNDVRETAELAWRVVPPSWCLKNGVTSHADEIQRCVSGDGPIGPAPDVVWVARDGTVFVARPGDTAAISLGGSAAAMWDAVTRSSSLDRAADEVAARYGVPPDRVRADLEPFISRLVERGLLVAR